MVTMTGTMRGQDRGTKTKLFKGLTQHDILTWEEEKMRYQRRVGHKVTDLQFLRYLLMAATRPVVTHKEGVTDARPLGVGPIYDKADTLLEKYRAHWTLTRPDRADRT